jgi:hypothetical protein
MAATAHYAGTPQGRSPEEIGAHGCTVVHVESDGRIRSRFVPTDVLRWQRERIVVAPTASLGELERILCDRARKLVAEGDQRPQIVAFEVAGLDRWTIAARKPGTPQRLVEKVRAEFARSQPPLWTSQVSFVTEEEQASVWFEEDTIRGDFLRAVRQWQTETAQELDLSSYLPPAETLSWLERDLSIDDPQQRRTALDDAAVLGVELLSAGDVGPTDRQLPATSAKRRKESRA